MSLRRKTLTILVWFSFAMGPLLATAAERRGALWDVVNACALDYALTGAPFPCMKVSPGEGAERGYAILRPPVGGDDIILTPTRKVAGLEDSFLQTSEAPNYFEAAWNERAVLAEHERQLPEGEEVALAVNSKYSRSQDQLHIHLGCLIDEAKATLAASRSNLSSAVWRKLANPIAGITFWGRVIPSRSLTGVNPFRIAFEDFDKGADPRGAVSIVLVGGALPLSRDEFILLRTTDDPAHPTSARSGTEILRPSCG